MSEASNTTAAPDAEQNLIRGLELLGSPAPNLDAPAPELLGVHVTSVQALAYLVSEGRFPATGAFKDVMYFAPLVDDEGEPIPYGEALKLAQAYGVANARTQYIIAKHPQLRGVDAIEMHNFMLGVTMEALDDESFPEISIEERIGAYCVSDTTTAEITEHTGLNQEEIVKLLLETKDIKGVAIDLANSIANDYKVGKGDAPEDPWDGDIHTRGGLPIEYVKRIEILGNHERRYFLLAVCGLMVARNARKLANYMMSPEKSAFA